jgi:hypothetical protein
MATQQITNYDAVVTPALSDEHLVQQAGVTGKETNQQILDNINNLTGKTTPVNADSIPLNDSAASDVAKKVTWANIKATIYSMADSLLSRPYLIDYAETVNAIGNSGAAQTVDLENGNVQTLTLNDDCTITFSNPPASGRSGSLVLIITKDANDTDRTITWGSTIKWDGGSSFTLLTTNAQVTILSFFTINGGTTWYGFVSGLSMQ